MAYRFGLDLGTASLGVVAVSLDAKRKPASLIKSTVRIFSEPTENDQGALRPKRAARRAARLQRRQIERRAVRLRRIAQLGSLIGIDPKTLPDNNGKRLSELRALAATQRIELTDFLRVLFKLAKRRGYSGGFKVSNADSGEVKPGVEKLRVVMEGEKCATLGQYLYSRVQRELPIKLKIKTPSTDSPRKKKTDEIPTDPEHENLYATREIVIDEFNVIWNKQTQFHDVLKGSADGIPIKQKFYEEIFRQLPLKSVAAMVGLCPLEKNLPRAPRAQPAAQAFRIEKQLADLRWGMGRRSQDISPAQKEVIRCLLREQETARFSTIEKELAENGCPKPSGVGLNMENIARDELLGDSTLAAFRSLGLQDGWLSLDETTQTQFINLLADVGSPELLEDPQWHTRMPRKGKRNQAITYRSFDPSLIEFVGVVVKSGKLDQLAAMGFDGGRMGYSVKALKKLTEWLRNPWWPADWDGNKTISEENAIRVCYRNINSRNEKQHALLPAHPPTGNDVVDGALRQLRYVVNDLIGKLGEPPTQVIIELTRELGVGLDARNKRQKQMDQNRVAREHAKKALRNSGAKPSGTNILRYQLAEEQAFHCPYCQGQNHFGIEAVTTGSVTDHEHILPKSLTQIGRKRSEIVLTHRACNDAKGDRTPWQAWGDGKDPERWRAVEAAAERFEEAANKTRNFAQKKALRRKAKLLLLKDFEQEVLTDESIADFTDRQFHQTSWIAKLAAQWLKTICADVSVSRGMMTAYLRRHWKLDTVIPEVRIEEGLPVLDTEGEVITPNDFAEYRRQWEGHPLTPGGPSTDRTLEKRVDHRHHLIDALVIALTDRSLYKKIAAQYRQDSERLRGGKITRIRYQAEEPLHDLREQTLSMIRECPLTHKPDRHPNGEFFQKFAYGAAIRGDKGELYLTRRIPLGDFADDKTSIDSARKNLKEIVSERVKTIVLTEFNRRIKNGMAAVQALRDPIEHPDYKKSGNPVLILKVRCYHDSAEDAIIVTHRNRQGQELTKRLRHKEYAWLDVPLKNGKLDKQRIPDIVPLERATKSKRATSKDVLRFYKGDTVQDTTNGKRYVVKQIRTTRNGMLVLSPIVETRPVKKLKKKDGLYCPSGRSLANLRII